MLLRLCRVKSDDIRGAEVEFEPVPVPATQQQQALFYGSPVCGTCGHATKMDLTPKRRCVGVSKGLSPACTQGYTARPCSICPAVCMPVVHVL